MKKVSIASAVEESLNLNQLWQRVLSELQTAIKDRHHDFHLMQVATLSNEDGFISPRLRTVVFRRFESEPLGFYFHTDERSPKFKELSDHSVVSLHFYSQKLKTQVRIQGHALALSHDHEIYLEHQKQISPSGVRCYMGPYSPSVELPEYHSNMSEAWKFRAPTKDEIPEIIQNFELIKVIPYSVDVLQLRATGHIRFGAKNQNNDPQWQLYWKAP